MENLFAHTEAGNDYPAYISINKDDDGRHRISVRSAGNGGRDLVQIHVSPETLEQMAIDLLAKLSSLGNEGTVTMLNPNHPVAKAAQDNNIWPKLVVALMVKQGVDHVVLTEQDIIAIQGKNNITLEELADGLHLRVVEVEEAQRLAEVNGGLPH